MKAPQWVRLLVLAFAVMSVVGVLAVLACGPSAPASQSGSGDKESPTATPVPTATPYPDDCVEVHHPTEEGMMTICPEPGPRQIQQELRKQYNRHMADKAAAAQDGRRAAVDPVMVDVLIHTSTEYAVDDVVGFLQRNGVARVHSTKGGAHSAGRVNAIVNIELLPSIIEIVGVQAVVKVPQAQPAGGNLQATSTLTAVQRTNVDAWHVAGVTGSGIEPTAEPTEEPTEEPTATRYVPPTADRSLCHVSKTSSDGTVLATRCPPDGHRAVAYILRQRYNRAMDEIEALDAEGETGYFPVLNIIVRTDTVEAVDDVIELLSANGVAGIHADRSPGYIGAGSVGAMINIGLIPQLVEIEGVLSVAEIHDGTRSHEIHEVEWKVPFALQERINRAWKGYEASVARGEEAEYPVVRVVVKFWGSGGSGYVLKFLKAHGGKNVKVSNEGGFGYEGTVEVDISLGLVWELSKVRGVRRVEEVASSLETGRQPRSAVPVPMPVPEAVLMQADQWHLAGFTGAGVGVGVGEFRQLKDAR